MGQSTIDNFYNKVGCHRELCPSLPPKISSSVACIWLSRFCYYSKALQMLSYTSVHVQKCLTEQFSSYHPLKGGAY